jgi:hypothetical protein
MSYAAGPETAAVDGGSVSSLSDVAQEGHSSRASASSGGSHHDGDPGDGSESESYVEVEQLGEDTGPPSFAPLATSPAAAQSPPCNNSGSNVVRHVTKRTLITLHQRSVLEEYYRNGMTSASQQLAEVHEVVAAKTGLDLSVVRVSHFTLSLFTPLWRLALFHAYHYRCGNNVRLRRAGNATRVVKTATAKSELIIAPRSPDRLQKA